MTSPELSDLDYLWEIERLADRVSVEARVAPVYSKRADRQGEPAAVGAGLVPRLEAAPLHDALPGLPVSVKVVQTRPGLR